MEDVEDRVFFEDVEVGAEIDCGRRRITEDDIVSFAERYDPLPMHVDPEAANAGPHDGLIASGYHTLSETVGLLVEHARGQRAVVAGVGIDDVRWHRPVRPDDEISPTMTITGRESGSKPGTGVVHLRIVVENGDGEVVLSYDDAELVERRGSDGKR